MNNYDEIKKLYDNSVIYNNEFINYDDDFSFWTYWIKKINPKRKIIISFTKKERSSTTRLISTTSPINKSDISFSNLIINYLGQNY